MARSFCARDRSIFLKVILPSALPLTLSGIRLGAGRGVKGLISGELFIAVVGLGGIIASAGRVLDATTVHAVMVFVVILSFAIVWAVGFVERRLVRWRPSTLR
jgi:NitT/TauT family transport system permease protein